MTILTDVTRQYVILILADGICPVVAANAIGSVVRMIESCRYPTVGRMTCIAIVPTRDMSRVLADRDRIVMTR